MSAAERLAGAPGEASLERQPAPRAGFGLSILTAINFLNYLDRFIVAGILPLLLVEFGRSKAEGGLLTTVFILVYMLAAPVAGILGDRVPRRFLVAGSVFVWSLATLASGFAPSFVVLLAARAVVGIGEAGYGAVAPAIISDLYPARMRTRMLSYFYVAIPVGSAAGFALGGWLGERYGWQTAFIAGGIPGILVAFATLFMPEPRRGAMEEGPLAPKVGFATGLKALGRNRVFWFNTAGYTLMTFAVGGLGHWMPTFLNAERGMSLETAGFAFGAVTAGAGLLGTLAGGWLGDLAERRMNLGGMYVSGTGLLLAAPFMYAAVQVDAAWAIFGLIFVAQFMLFLNSGPINNAIVSCVGPDFRAFAMGLNVLFIHLLGDAISPPLIGAIADRSTLERAIELNAIPVLLGGAVLIIGVRLMTGGGRAPSGGVAG